MSVGFRGFWSFSVGFRPGFLPPRAYLTVCVSVALFLSTETSLYVLEITRGANFECRFRCEMGRGRPEGPRTYPDRPKPVENLGF